MKLTSLDAFQFGFNASWISIFISCIFRILPGMPSVCTKGNPFPGLEAHVFASRVLSREFPHVAPSALEGEASGLDQQFGSNNDSLLGAWDWNTEVEVFFKHWSYKMQQLYIVNQCKFVIHLSTRRSWLDGSLRFGTWMDLAHSVIFNSHCKNETFRFMVGAVSPASICADETISTLRFASSVKRVKTVWHSILWTSWDFQKNDAITFDHLGNVHWGGTSKCQQEARSCCVFTGVRWLLCCFKAVKWKLGGFVRMLQKPCRRINFFSCKIVQMVNWI